MKDKKLTKALGDCTTIGTTLGVAIHHPETFAFIDWSYVSLPTTYEIKRKQKIVRRIKTIKDILNEGD